MPCKACCADQSRNVGAQPQTRAHQSINLAATVPTYVRIANVIARRCCLLHFSRLEAVQQVAVCHYEASKRTNTAHSLVPTVGRALTRLSTSRQRTRTLARRLKLTAAGKRNSYR